MNTTEGPQTILLVEDEALIAMDEQIALESYGYTGVTANTGELAVEIYRTNAKIDLVLMDINLGQGMSGPEAANRILKDRQLPVVFLSNLTETVLPWTARSGRKEFQSRCCGSWKLSLPAAAILASMILMFGIPVIAADTNLKTATDLSVRGPLAVETLEFPNLVDVNRSGSEPPAARPRLLPRLRSRLFPQHENTVAITERRIPIKVHIPATGGPFPIIIVSHGAGGNWDTHYAQAQHLASHGYAVLCLEHVGSNTDRLKSGIRLMHNLNKMIRDANEVLGRPKDVSFAIDRASEWNVSNANLRGRLDTKHVGVLGHSFGAFTTMVVCGMRPALEWLEPPVEPGKGLGPYLRDARVTCGVALSPQGADEPFFIGESFATLSLPLMGISGTEDKQQGGLPPMNRYKAFALWPEREGQNKFVWLANAHHLDFTDSTGAKQQGARSANREDVQPIVRAATLLFFNTHLKGDTSAAGNLTTSGLQKYLRGAVNSAEVRSR